MREHTDWDWRTQAKCAALSAVESDMLFFPETGRSINKAKAFCLNCPVAVSCLEYALDNDVYGVWAGTSSEERRRILKFREKLSGVVTVKIVARKNITFH